MTIRLLVASLLTAAIASADASQQPAGQSAAAGPPASLSGVIVEAQTGSPVAGALVTLIGGEESRPAIRTTGDGRFSFASIRPGDYTLYVSAQSFVPLRFGAASPGDPGTSIVARPGASVTLTVPLVRGGVIAGTVTTEAGDPFIHASIGLWRRGYSPQTGERTIVQVWPVGGVTDDRGQYRLFNVPPGEYFVATTGEEPPRQGPQAGRPDDRAVRVMTHADVQAVRQTFVAPPPAIVVRATPTLTFYPGVARPQDAAPISIAPGQDIASVDFVVKTAPLATVAGSITAGTVAADLSRATIGLRATGLRAIISNFHHMFGWVDGGRFSLMGVHPGEYILFASVVVDQVTLQAEERLTVSGRDISGIALTLEPGITVSGRVQYASAPPELAPRFRFVFRHIDDLSSNIVGTIPAVDVDGARAFTLAGLRRGLYRIELVSVSNNSGWWMPSAIVNGIDAADTPVEISEGSVTDVVITVTTTPGEIAGAAPASRTVVVFPVDRAFWQPRSRRIAGVRPSSDGQYIVRRLPPGEYFVAGADGIEPGQWFNREFLQEIAATATRVRLAAGDRKRVDVK